ncbi:MAG: hypothetical protein KDB27_24450 [Planctomycetales bacterium]|nr:hypothetical protein [Planctomycetales bacterium]
MHSTKRNLSSVGLASVVVAVAISTGCTPWQLAKRTLFSELNEYPRVTDGRLASKQYSRWARDEWHEFAATSGENHSSDYISGFIYGFTKYVHAGGKTDPPAVPPRRYWRVGYKNQRGRAAIQDWYNGYAHGAETAAEKGYRERATLPSSMLLGYNAAAEAAWERYSGSTSAENNFPVVNEPTLAEPANARRDVETLPPPGRDKSKDSSDTSDPFVDDEKLPDVPPVVDPSLNDGLVNENPEAGDSSGGESIISVPSFEGQPEVDDALDTFDEADGGSDDSDFFGDQVFRSVPARTSQPPIQIGDAPPRPPWMTENEPELFPVDLNDNTIAQLPEPTAASSQFRDIAVEPPRGQSRFEQASFQTQLPEDLRLGDRRNDEIPAVEHGTSMKTNSFDSGSNVDSEPVRTSSDHGAWKPR